MKRYFAKLFALLFAVALPFAVYFAWVQRLPPAYSGSIMGTVHYKIDLLKETPSPRIILAGGSSSPYGTNCTRVSEAMGMPCINVGVTAYFGVDFYLSMLSQNMRAGDVIILAPEASMLEDIVIYTTIWSGIENNFDAWKVVPLHYWPKLAGSYHIYAGEKAYLSRGQKNEPIPEAHHKSFGPLGDVTEYREAILEKGWNSDDPIALSPDILNDHVVDALNRFYKKAQRTGVQVYLAFAPVDALAVTTAPEEWDALEEELRARLNMPVLGHLRDAVMPAVYFYDSNNHLTTEGAGIYTAALAEKLLVMQPSDGETLSPAE